MPILKCSACNKLQTIKTVNWKLVSKVPFAHICSRECFLKWIKSGKSISVKNDGFIVCSSPAITTGASYSEKLDKFFRSRYESAVAEYLSLQNIDFLYEAGFFEVGKNSIYIPDFYLPENNSFIEVKGLFSGGSKTKYINLKKKYSKIRILLLSWLLHKEFY